MVGGYAAGVVMLGLVGGSTLAGTLVRSDLVETAVSITQHGGSLRVRDAVRNRGGATAPRSTVMEELGLASFPKTSGATGLHILCPIRPELSFPEVRDFARALAKEVELRIGDQRVATTTWKVADRRGVFVDYGQNARDRTIASAYSIRPTLDARASTPLRWEEVPEVGPSAFTLETVGERLAEVGDLTAGMWRRKVSLLPRFEALGLTPPS